LISVRCTNPEKSNQNTPDPDFFQTHRTLSPYIAKPIDLTHKAASVIFLPLKTKV